MNRRRFAKTILPLGLLPLIGCNDGGGGDSNPTDTGLDTPGATPDAGGTEAGVDIMAFGDSITNGYGVSESYGRKLERITGREVIREGKNGENASNGGPARIGAALDRFKPTTLLLLEGINDCNRRIPPESAAAGLRSMIATARSKGVKKIIVGTIPALIGPMKDNNDLVIELNKLIKGLGVTVADINPRLLPEMMLPDGIHPNNAGHSLIASVFASKL